MLGDLADDPTAWEHIDLKRFALWGGVFTVGLDLLIYPLEVIKTKMMVDSRVCYLLMVSGPLSLATPAITTEGACGFLALSNNSKLPLHGALHDAMTCVTFLSLLSTSPKQPSWRRRGERRGLRWRPMEFAACSEASRSSH